jgi:hypothetical protein
MKVWPLFHVRAVSQDCSLGRVLLPARLDTKTPQARLRGAKRGKHERKPAGCD